MKAVILAAGGHTSIEYMVGTIRHVRRFFPPGSKPKCLYHVDGEVILARTVRCLREVGIHDIRIVVGYHWKHIADFNSKHKLGLEIVYNPDWEIDAVSSLQTGIRDMDDDVLILFGDVIVNTKVIKAFMARPEPLVRIKLVKRLYRVGEDENMIHIVKVAREKLGIFDKAHEHMERCMKSHAVYDDVSYGTGIALVCALTETLRQNEPVSEVLVHPPLKEVDLLVQTDEGKKYWGIK